MQYLKRTPGFTIVELLIVIVVIGILATITLVTYSGVQKMAAKTVVQSDLENASTTIKVAVLNQGLQTVTSFPAEVKASAKVGLSLSNPTNGGTFCVNGTYEGYGDVLYHYDSEQGLQTGTCSGAVIASSAIGTGTTPVIENPQEPEPSGPVVSDNFNRANSTTSLGNAQTGQSWAVFSGTWGISGNTAYSVSAVDGDIIGMNAGVSNVEISVKISGNSGGHFPGIIFRGDLTTNSYYMVEIAGPSNRIDLFSSVSPLEISGANDTFYNDDVLTIRAKDVSGGVQITILVNGSVVSTHTDTYSPRPSGTYVGLRHGKYEGAPNSLRFDDFTVTAL